MAGAATQPLQATSFNVEQRLRRIEGALNAHLGVFPGHDIREGLHHFTTLGNTTTEAIFSDENRTRRIYEQTIIYSLAAPAEIESATETFYNQNNQVAAQYIYRSYVYVGGVLLSYFCEKVI